MKPNIITCSGIDGGPIGDILDFLEKCAGFPVEIGIQVSATRQGEPRYPTLEWTESLLRELTIQNIGAVALHINGSFARSIADEGIIPDVLANQLLAIRYQTGKPVVGRIQINMNESKRPDLLAKVIEDHPDVRFILQIHDGTEHLLLDPALAHSHFDIILDKSRGRGMRDQHLRLPEGSFGRFVTFAGGMSPETIADDVASISTVIGEHPFGLDAESGLRATDRFCFKRALKFVTNACGNKV